MGLLVDRLLNNNFLSGRFLPGFVEFAFEFVLGFLEFAEALAKPSGQFRQLFRSEKEEHQEKKENEFWTLGQGKCEEWSIHGAQR